MGDELPFRREATERKAYRTHGSLLLATHPPNSLLVWILVVFVGVLLVFAALAKFSKTVTVQGFLEPTGGVARVVAPKGGIAEAIYVKVGQRIKKGSPLITVEGRQISEYGEDPSEAVLESFLNEKSILKKMLVDQLDWKQSQRQRLMSKARYLEKANQNIDKEITCQRHRVELATKIVRMARTLRRRRLISDIEFKSRQDNLLQQEEALTTLEQDREDKINDYQDTLVDLKQLSSIAAERVQPLVTELDAIRRNIVKQRQEQSYSILSPIRGLVTSIEISKGESVGAKNPIIWITPENEKLEAFLYVPTRSIGFMQVGQSVNLLYDAYPYQQFGIYHGRISGIDRTVLDHNQNYPIQPSEPSYLVHVHLHSQIVEAYGRSLSLRPDMLIHAEIVLGRYSIMDWILFPFKSIHG